MERKLIARWDTHVPGLGNFKKGQEVKSSKWAKMLAANQDFEYQTKKAKGGK